jgi:hypothetical protein
MSNLKASCNGVGKRVFLPASIAVHASSVSHVNPMLAKVIRCFFIHWHAAFVTMQIWSDSHAWRLQCFSAVPSRREPRLKV